MSAVLCLPTCLCVSAAASRGQAAPGERITTELPCNKLVPKGAEQLAHYAISRLGRNLLRVLPNPGRSLGAHD